MERLKAYGNFSGHIGKLRKSQIARAADWDGIPDSNDSILAAATQIRCIPKNASTTTYVNALNNVGGTWRDPDGTFGEMGGPSS